jgi:AmmeMemoRadiSam system protein A
LRTCGASFVTLARGGALRGCVGTLEPARPLADDVCRNVIAAASGDPRFPPVLAGELDSISIQISCLTPLKQLSFRDADELLCHCRPGVDGVLFQDGLKRATFLPEVWKKLPEPEQFFGQLCKKMGAPFDAWRQGTIEAFIYQAETFKESTPT